MNQQTFEVGLRTYSGNPPLTASQVRLLLLRNTAPIEVAVVETTPRPLQVGDRVVRKGIPSGSGGSGTIRAILGQFAWVSFGSLTECPNTYDMDGLVRA